MEAVLDLELISTRVIPIGNEFASLPGLLAIVGQSISVNSFSDETVVLTGKVYSWSEKRANIESVAYAPGVEAGCPPIFNKLVHGL